jgi:hypothetical protein
MATQEHVDHREHSDERDGGQDHPPFKFSVDSRPFESDQPVLTGAQIKARASVDPSFGLFLEGRDQAPDQQIGDSEPVDLRKPGRERFYTAPPANFGTLR